MIPGEEAESGIVDAQSTHGHSGSGLADALMPGVREQLAMTAGHARRGRFNAPVAWAIAILLAAASVVVSAQGTPQTEPGTLQMWATRTADGATFRLYNGSAQRDRYELQVGPVGSTNPTSITIDLAPGQQWEETVGFPAAWSHSIVLGSLYVEGEATRLRAVQLSPAQQP